MLPIVVVIVFSFNDPAGRYNYTWEGFTLDHWTNPFGPPFLGDAVTTSIQVALIATLVATVLGTLIALALVRYHFRGRGATNFLIFVPLTAPEIVLGASLLTLFLNLGTALGLLDDRARAHHVLHQLRGRDGARPAGRLRPPRRGGGRGPRRERVRRRSSGSRCR